MEKLNDLKKSLDQTEALVQICKDMVDQKKRETKILFIALIVSIFVNLLIVGSFLWYESNWDYTTSQTDSTVTTTTQEVDSGTKRSAIKTGIEHWVKWEKETKKLYEDMYQELINIHEIAAAEKFVCCIGDVDEELKCAQRKHLDLEAIGYDLPTIVIEQHDIHERYRHKLEKLELVM